MPSGEWSHAFPGVPHDCVELAARMLPRTHTPLSARGVFQGYSDSWPSITLDGTTIDIPYRMYNPPIAEMEWNRAATADRKLLACMYSRHHDGRVRQWATRHLLSSSEPYVAPFVIQLLGEYVIEIVRDINGALIAGGDRSSLLTVLKAFLEENPQPTALIRQQAASYWDAYYRYEYASLAQYPGILALDYIAGRVGDIGADRAG